ncbi:MAG: endopeptidase [Actinomycetota bacterium]|nr:endopeptidase [Actinomycetota bacterium]
MLVVAAVVGAAVVALASRAPASLRDFTPPQSATDPSLGAHFTPKEIAQHGAFSRGGYVSFVVTMALTVLTLILLRKPVGAFVDRIERFPVSWPVVALATVLLVVVVVTVVTLPAAFVRGYQSQHAWHLSTQSVAGWFSDQARSLLVTGVTAALAALAFFGAVRWQPRVWWLWAWAGLSLLTIAIVYLYPIVITPLFNRFTPLHDASLNARIHQIADQAGVPIDRVLVADASKRSITENAYVAGFGSSRRLVLYDTLLRGHTEDEVLFVVAHELGHYKHNHVLKGALLSVIGLFVTLGVLAWLARSDRLWAWAGAGGIRDIRAVPMLLLFAVVATLLTLPVQNTISRHFESQADSVAFALTADPDVAVRSFRQIALTNLADLAPPRIAVWALFTHPPTADRIEAALAHRSSSP